MAMISAQPKISFSLVFSLFNARSLNSPGKERLINLEGRSWLKDMKLRDDPPLTIVVKNQRHFEFLTGIIISPEVLILA